MLSFIKEMLTGVYRGVQSSRENSKKFCMCVSVIVFILLFWVGCDQIIMDKFCKLDIHENIFCFVVFICRYQNESNSDFSLNGKSVDFSAHIIIIIIFHFSLSCSLSNMSFFLVYFSFSVVVLSFLSNFVLLFLLIFFCFLWKKSPAGVDSVRYCQFQLRSLSGVRGFKSRDIK